MIDESLIAEFITIVGDKNALTTADDLTHYTHENRDKLIGKTPLVIKPADTKEVQQIVQLAAKSKTALVPQGGHTGHMGGGVPDESGTQIVVSLERMNTIEDVDVAGNVLICGSGTVLQSIQECADGHDRLFPLSLGSQGSCQIGGNISTNAGGTGVLTYGNTRELVLGLEVVLPNGEVWDGMRRLKKDNTGYSLKNLFIGAEGTLGIITKCVLKLFPKPKGKCAALCGLRSPKAALEFFNQTSEMAGHSLTAFELMGMTPYKFAMQHIEGLSDPLVDQYPWYVLLEFSSNTSEEDAQAKMEEIMSVGMEQELIQDAVCSQSLSQFQSLWDIREKMPLAQKSEGASMKYDISVPIHAIPQFIDEGYETIRDQIPEARPCTFGHMGDGNLHFNVSQPVSSNSDEFMAWQDALDQSIYALVISMGGSISAEHGIGLFKKNMLHETKSPVELELMRSLKQAIDPQNIFNPGKIV